MIKKLLNMPLLKKKLRLLVVVLVQKTTPNAKTPASLFPSNTPSPSVLKKIFPYKLLTLKTLLNLNKVKKAGKKPVELHPSFLPKKNLAMIILKKLLLNKEESLVRPSIALLLPCPPVKPLLPQSMKT